MSIYRCAYQSMSAFYGPHFIEADSEHEAKLRFLNSGTFSRDELPLISARLVSESEIRRALAEREAK